MPVTSSKILAHPSLEPPPPSPVEKPAEEPVGPFAEPEDAAPEPPTCCAQPLLPEFPLFPPLEPTPPPLQVFDVATVMLASFALGVGLTAVWAWSISKRPVALCPA